ncbi:MAG: class II aldolase/adducin family protein [Symploca sp. SIO1A3]|nr:class II aldolase/adducin family protein [Symploca sp. SIO1A3]
MVSTQLLRSLPQPPQFTSFEEERQSRKQHLVAACRVFAQLGFVLGVAGHISVRDPEHLDCFWITPFGKHFSLVRTNDLIKVNHQGEILEGKQKVTREMFNIHSGIHQTRPDVIAVAHAHPVYGTSWCSLGRLLEPISQDACTFYEDHSLFTNYSGLISNSAEGQRLAEALGNNKAVILQNHGLLTVGHSVDEAAWWLICMERCCQAQLIAETVGNPILIEPDIARLTRSQVGSHEAGWLCFQPYYEMILAEEPNL